MMDMFFTELTFFIFAVIWTEVRGILVEVWSQYEGVTTGIQHMNYEHDNVW